jgi:hypothetical protein
LTAAALLVVVDALTEEAAEAAEEVSGCLFVVIEMSSMIHADMVEARSILSALLVRIGIHLRGRNMLLLLMLLLPHQYPQQHQRHRK